MNIIIPSGQGGMFKPRKNLRQLAAGGLNILKKTWTDVMIDAAKYKLCGFVGYDIIDAESGIILKHVEPKPNLILNCGKDLTFSNLFANCFLYGHLSTDTTTPAATDTTMAGWVKQSNTYGSGDGAWSVSGDVYSITRSFVFTAETGDQTYTKFYSTHASGSSATPFNEIVFGTPITLSSGQQAKVTMTLEITITPHTTAATYSSDVISGVSGSTGSARIPFFEEKWGGFPNLSRINSDGSTTNNYGLEPSSIASIYNSTQRTYVSAALTSLLAAADRQTSSYTLSYSTTGLSLSTYTSGSFSRYKVALADLSECNISNVASVGFVASQVGYPAMDQIQFQFLTDTLFTKLNTQKLTLNFQFSVS